MSLTTPRRAGTSEPVQVELTFDLARALACDDAFRAALEHDPAAALERLGVTLRAGDVPRRVVLPPRELCRDRLGVAPAAAAGAKTSASPVRGTGAAGRGGAVETMVKRQHFSFFRFHDRYFLDVRGLLAGELRISRSGQLLGASLADGAEVPLGPEELEVLTHVPSTRWIALSALRGRVRAGERTVQALVEKGLLLTSGEDERSAALRGADERMAAVQWDPYAALYHYMARWRGQNLDGEHDWAEEYRDVGRGLGTHAGKFGPAPPAFHQAPNATARVALPLEEGWSERFRGLLERRTTRVFDRSRPLPAATLSALLRHVWGAHGYAPLADGVVGLRKTSPSGGSLHPTECYPLLLRVEGMAPGVYHYSVRDHALEVIETMDVDEAERLVNVFTAGQSYFASAAAVFLMTSRFYRSFWKYRQHRKAYRVLMMDAAHLSQTLYTVAGELGLGAFFTAAVNEVDVEERLGLDGFQEGPVAVSGCGYPEEGAWGTLDARPYVPGVTGI